MSSRIRKTFVELCLNGEALLSDIDAHVERWHKSDTDIPLHDYLGLSLDEYALWVEKPEALRFIVAARKQALPLEKALPQMEQNSIAARAANHDELTEVVQWLKAKGML